MMEEFSRNFTVQELTDYFDMKHQIFKYQVKNYNNTGLCFCTETNAVTVDCTPPETYFGVMFFWIFSFICIVSATLMYAFDYVTDFKTRK